MHPFGPPFKIFAAVPRTALTRPRDFPANHIGTVRKLSLKHLFVSPKDQRPRIWPTMGPFSQIQGALWSAHGVTRTVAVPSPRGGGRSMRRSMQSVYRWFTPAAASFERDVVAVLASPNLCGYLRNAQNGHGAVTSAEKYANVRGKSREESVERGGGREGAKKSLRVETTQALTTYPCFDW